MRRARFGNLGFRFRYCFGFCPSAPPAPPPPGRCSYKGVNPPDEPKRRMDFSVRLLISWRRGFSFFAASHIGHPTSASLITSYACFSFLCRVARELTQGSAERNQFCRRGTKSRRWRKIPTRTM